MNTRFKINVGEAYGSDMDLFIKILVESAMGHPDISDKNLVDVRLVNFGIMASLYHFLKWMFT